MANQRMTGKREELNALWSQVNKLVTDLTSSRSGIVSTIARANNRLLSRIPLAALVSDLTELRTKLAAAIVDLPAIRTPVAAGVVDLGVLHATLTALQADVTRLRLRQENTVLSKPGVDDGTTAGKLKTTNATDYLVDGKLVQKAGTDDLWDFTGETNLGAGDWKAYYLLLDASGTATISAGTVSTVSEADAIVNLPAHPESKCVVGVYVAGNSTNFGAALAAQGTIIEGEAAAYALTSSAPAALTASAPAALTSTAPAALTTSATVSITDGTTAGNLKIRADVEYTIAGTMYRKAATDDLWNLSGETDTTGAQYRAYWLYLDSAGTASIAAGSNAASSAAALAALPALDGTKAVIGVYVAGLSTDFDDAGGLAAQGTITDGFPAAISDPSAMTSSTTTLVAP